MVSKIRVDETLLTAVIDGTTEGLSMTGLKPSPVGVTKLQGGGRTSLSVMVGLVGRSSGSVVLSATERGVYHLVTHFIGEEITSLDEDCLDAFMELGNIVAGSLKTTLDHTEHQIDKISLPSLIFGASYEVYYSQGIETCSVQFELDQFPIQFFRDRYFSTSVSLMRGSGN